MKGKASQRSWLLILLAAPKSILVGGQAVIEGVLMRVPGAYALAVRNPHGEIITRRQVYQSITERFKFLKIPVIRGTIALFESLKLGISTLNESADIAFEEESSKEMGWKEKLASFFSTLLALAIGLGLFFITPIFIAGTLFGLSETAFLFNVVSGLVRIILFLTYLWAISKLDDVKRLFQYHGAEHKTVYTFEAGQDLNLDNARPFQTQHPRCGTSFVFIVLLSSILMFAIIDSIFMIWMGDLGVKLRLAIHLPLIPFVAGVGYEVLKLTSKYRHIAWVRGLAAPGIWLQNITTTEPDDQQLEVALESLRTAFGDELDDYLGKYDMAEAID